MRDKVTVVQCDDYVAVFVNGKNVWVNHSIHADSVFREMNIDYEQYYIEDMDEAEDFAWDQSSFDPASLPPSAVKEG